eukprot:Skav213548  [mRNA]  locus=scaffold263:16464:17630:+ [translate_table: standard]
MNVAPWFVFATLAAFGESLFLRHDARQDYPQLASLLASVRTATLSNATVVSTAPYLHGIEEALVSMAQGISQAPGDLIKNVKTDVMATISDQLKPRIVGEHKLIQSQIAEFSTLFAKCEAEREVGLNNSFVKQSAIPVLIANHKACRWQESHLGHELASCRETLQSSRQVDTSTCDGAKMMDQIPDISSCAALNGEDAETYYDRMLQQLHERLKSIRIRRMLCANTTGALKLQQSVCEGQEAEIQRQRSSCNEIQGVLDSSVCDLSTSMSTTCAQYKACRSQATLSYDLVHHTVKAREDTLHEEWKALQRIECILDAMSSSNVVAATRECNQALYSVSHLLVNYVTIPPCQPCEALAEVPGTIEYNNTVFKELPEDVALAMCSADCCY